MKVISVKQMRDLDQRTITEHGTPGEVLMERAGIGAADYLLDFLSTLHPRHIKRLIFLAGKGNNGGDAHVMARYLADQLDADILVWAVCPISELKGDARLNADRLPTGIVYEHRTVLSPNDFKPGDILVDGLLGTGIKGDLKTPYAQWIDAINATPCPVIALDIPSGLNGDNGTFVSRAVQAELTISMGLPKTGFIRNQGPAQCGLLKNVEIGIPQSYIDETDADIEMVFEQDILPLFSPLNPASHKGLQGRVLILGGSKFYKGAPFLSARAALRSGAGLVFMMLPATDTYAVSDTHSLIVQHVDDGGMGVFTTDSVAQIRERAEKVDVIVVGPGMAMLPESCALLEYLNRVEATVVYDADALNLLAANPNLWQRQGKSILTPHPGEMGRLLDGFDLSDHKAKSRPEQAKALSQKLKATVLLKGQHSVIATLDGQIFINSSGSPALATAGSGDVLSGIIGAWAAVLEHPEDAVKAGAFIHGLSGELHEFGNRGLTADDLVDLIPITMAYLSPFA